MTNCLLACIVLYSRIKHNILHTIKCAARWISRTGGPIWCVLDEFGEDVTRSACRSLFERRDVKLADGSKIIFNDGTTILVHAGSIKNAETDDALDVSNRTIFLEDIYEVALWADV